MHRNIVNESGGRAGGGGAFYTVEFEPSDHGAAAPTSLEVASLWNGAISKRSERPATQGVYRRWARKWGQKLKLEAHDGPARTGRG